MAVRERYKEERERYKEERVIYKEERERYKEEERKKKEKRVSARDRQREKIYISIYIYIRKKRFKERGIKGRRKRKKRA